MSRRRFRVNGNGAGVAPYSQGWRAPWRGEWGPLGDAHSKLGHLVKREERQLMQAGLPEGLGLRREVAELRAIGKMLRAQLGLDAKVTVRKITAIEKIADWKLARLEALVGRGNGHGGPSLEAIRARYSRPAEASP